MLYQNAKHYYDISTYVTRVLYHTENDIHHRSIHMFTAWTVSKHGVMMVIKRAHGI